MLCNKCKFENQIGANYCESCGELLVKKTGSQKASKRVNKNHKSAKIKNKNSNLNVFNYLMSHKQIWLFTSIFLTVLIVIVTINTSNNKFEKPTNRFRDIASLNPIIEAKVFEIAANFVCGCGSCNEESLEICKCNYAIEERQFIRDYLEQNRNSTDIISAMTSKYGGLKSENKTDKKGLNTFKIPSNISVTEAGVASIYDRENIYSAFKCPCGQCGVDELKDCTCNHKNGAQEVKKYIDDKISENQFSVAQIIDIVNNTYGGKK